MTIVIPITFGLLFSLFVIYSVTTHMLRANRRNANIESNSGKKHCRVE
jgi:hypothetical protein